jgi:hypothetical protein
MTKGGNEKKGWTTRKLSWLEALLSDDRLPPAAKTIAAKYAVRYFNEHSEEGYAGLNKIEEDLHISKRNSRRLIKILVTRGWLTLCHAGGRGGRWARGKLRDTNRYRLSYPANYKAPIGRSNLTDREVKSDRLGRSAVTSKHVRDSVRDSVSSSAAASGKGRTGGRTGKRSQASQSNGRYRARPTIPEFGPEEAKTALNIAGWDSVRARQEFETNKRNFRQWNRDRGVVSWITWCEQGREIDKKNAARQSNGGGGPRRDLQGQSGVMRAYNKHKSLAANNDD